MADFHTDVLVVGGGPAGLTAAIAARRKGLQVILADPAYPPIDKSCGEGLMPDAIQALAKLGVTLPAGMGGLFRGIRFVDGEVTVDGAFPAGTALAVRRTVLHQTLVDAAAEAGVTLWWGAAANGLTAEGALIGEETIACRWLIGADGGQSRVRHWAALRAHEKRVRYGFRRHYRAAPGSDRVEVHWGPRFQVYISPEGPEEICVALLSDDPHLRIDEALEQFPELMAQLEGKEHLSQERGGISATRRLPTVTQGRIALVGDASGSVDAITGEGLGLAFQQALALAECLVTDDLDAYEAAHRRIFRRSRLMGSLLLRMGDQPRLRQQVMETLARRPGIFAGLLAFHVGAVTRTARSLVSAVKMSICLRVAAGNAFARHRKR